MHSGGCPVIRLFAVLIFLFPCCVLAVIDVENSDAESFTLSCSVFARYSVYGERNVIPDEEFSIRRASLTAEFELSDALDGELQVETRPTEVYLKDCYLNWEPLAWAGVRVGQFKKPFCRGSMTSGWNLLTMDRSLMHQLVSDLRFSGRDLGVQFTLAPPGDLMPVITGGIFNGAPIGTPKDNNEKQLAGRCTFTLPWGIELSGGVSSVRLGEADPLEPSGYVFSTRQWCIGGDVCFSRNVTPDLEIRGEAEYIRGPNWSLVNIILGEEPPDFSGFRAACGGMFDLSSVPGLRSLEANMGYEMMKPDSTDAEETLLSPVIGVWFSPGIRVRAGAEIHSFSGMAGVENYTDYILEAAVRF
jgi:hypothetical protein